MSTITTPAGRVLRTEDVHTSDIGRTRADVRARGGRVVSSSPSGAGYVVRVAYPVAVAS